MPLSTLIPSKLTFGVNNHSKFLGVSALFDDVIAQPFQLLASHLSSQGYRLNKVLRDVECLVISGWIVTFASMMLSTYGVTEKFLAAAVALTILAAERKLLLAHLSMCKLGWNREVSELYRTSALRYKERFRPFRLLSLFAFASLPVFTLAFDPEWQSADVTAYLTLLIYICKFYIERSFPTDDWGLDRMPVKAGEAI